MITTGFNIPDWTLSSDRSFTHALVDHALTANSGPSLNVLFSEWKRQPSKYLTRYNTFSSFALETQLCSHMFQRTVPTGMTDGLVCPLTRSRAF